MLAHKGQMSVHFTGGLGLGWGVQKPSSGEGASVT